MCYMFWLGSSKKKYPYRKDTSLLSICLNYVLPDYSFPLCLIRAGGDFLALRSVSYDQIYTAWFPYRLYHPFTVTSQECHMKCEWKTVESHEVQWRVREEQFNCKHGTPEVHQMRQWLISCVELRHGRTEL